MLSFLGQARVKRILCMLFALPAVFSFTYLLRTGWHFTMINHSIVSILLWWACWKVMERAVERPSVRLFAVCVPMGLVFALMMVLGSSVYQYNDCRITEMKTWAGVVCAWPLFAAVSALLIQAMPKAPVIRLPFVEKRLGRFSDRTFFLLCWGLIFLAWLPGLIASYPGVYGYDCIYQIDYYLKGRLLTHHPVLHTWWLGFCVVTLGKLLGSYEAGMCVYSLVQMALLSACFAGVVGFMRRRKAGSLLQLCCLLAFMFLPIHAVFSFSGTKDVLFAALVIRTLLWMLDAASNPPDGWKPWGGLALLGFGMTALRNQGLYVFIFAMLFGLLVMKGMRRRVLAALAAVLIMTGVYQGPGYALLNAEKARNTQEMLSVPIVQLSAARMHQGRLFTDQQAQALESYIPDYGYYDFTTWAISDPLKNTFNNDLFHEDPMAFFRLWAQIGLKAPETYLTAFLRLTLGWWYPDAHFRDPASWHPYYEYLNTWKPGNEWVLLERTTPKALSWLAGLYEDLAQNNSDQKIPVLSLLTSCGLAAWVMLGFIGWAVFWKKWRMLMPAALLFGLWGTLLLGPVVLLRYGYSLLIAVPVWIAVMRTE